MPGWSQTRAVALLRSRSLIECGGLLSNHTLGTVERPSPLPSLLPSDARTAFFSWCQPSMASRSTCLLLNALDHLTTALVGVEMYWWARAEKDPLIPSPALTPLPSIELNSRKPSFGLIPNAPCPPDVEEAP